MSTNPPLQFCTCTNRSLDNDGNCSDCRHPWALHGEEGCEAPLVPQETELGRRMREALKAGPPIFPALQWLTDPTVPAPAPKGILRTPQLVPWSDPEAKPLEDVRRHLRQAEEEYAANLGKPRPTAADMLNAAHGWFPEGHPLQRDEPWTDEAVRRLWEDIENMPVPWSVRARLYASRFIHNVVAHPLLMLCPPVGEWLHRRTEP